MINLKFDNGGVSDLTTKKQIEGNAIFKTFNLS